MTWEMGARIGELREETRDKPGWWVALAREVAAEIHGHKRPYSQMDLAAACGKDRATIQRWEKDGIDHLTWVGMLHYIGLPPDWTPPPGRAPVQRGGGLRGRKDEAR